jgi:signal transduction histidine kinase/DNA-binding NarL/FixJ family response regulator
MPERCEPAAAHAFGHDGGIMAGRICGYDWSHHPLGPAEQWPGSLRHAVELMLASRFPMWLGWGPELHFLCNDAYLPALGFKETWALGAPARTVWEEVWEALGPRAGAVVQTGVAAWEQSLRLFVQRSGYAEETYHTLSLSPLRDDSGAIGGLLCVALEETARVIGERRRTLLQAVSADLSGVTTEPALFAALARALARHPEELPFVLVYRFEDPPDRARLAFAHGATAGEPLAPPVIDCFDARQSWPARGVLEGSPMLTIEDLPLRFSRLPIDPWNQPPRLAVALAIANEGAEHPAGFIVAGLNPYRPLDGDYAGMLETFAGQLGTALAAVRAADAAHRRAESLAALDRAKSAFLSNVSHELRTPLTLMLGPLEDALNDAALSGLPGVRDLVTIAHRNALRLLKTANTLLDLSMIEAGRLQPAFAPTDLARVTADLAGAFRPIIEKAGLRLVLDCPDLCEPVYVDPDMWEKIVLNLLSNAYKFTLVGEIRVRLRQVGECVELSVQDTGAGIPPEARPHLFERFHRVRATPSRTDEGTGIGLSLVLELVKAHGGNLHVESEPGAGTTFTVFLRRGDAHLPRDRAPVAPRRKMTGASFLVEEAGRWAGETGIHEPTTAAPAGEAAGAAAGSGGRVLVVDDNEDMRRYISRLLAPHYEVLTAGDGTEALEVVQSHRPDLVLSDVSLPNMDGVRLLQAIRSQPESRTLPVILLSGHAGEESRVEGLEAGADDYLIKPFSARELLARVNVHLDMARIRIQAQDRERELRTNAEVFARALRESSERLSASLTAAGTGTFRWDIQTKLFDCDEPLERMLLLGAAESPRSLVDFLRCLHNDDRAHVAAGFERCAREGTDFEVEFRVPLRDGSIRWVDAKAKTFFDPSGDPVYMIGACVDVTKRKQSEAFVWRQKDVLEQIVQGAPLSDVLETLTLDVEQVSEHTVVALILMLDESGARLHPVAGRRAPAGWREHLAGFPVGPAAASCGAAVFRKERVIVPDINYHPLWRDHRAAARKHGLRACWSTPIFSSGGHVLGTFDLYHREPAVPTEQELKFVEIATRTAAIAVERERAQQALKESKAKLEEYAQTLELRVAERTARLQETVLELESFSYSISHDMRAPLRAMQSFAQILAEDCGNQVGPEGKDCIRRIVSASNRMDRLIQDVLTYSRVAGTELKLQRVDLQSLLAGILESYPQFHAPQAQIEVVPPLPAVLANEAALTQCLSNLIGNAIKFVAPGVTPQVRIWAERTDPRVRLFIRDNGIGIEKEAHEKIFRIFHQLNRAYEGTGIGLSVVRKAAERMGGSVGVESEPGKGSTFHLELDLAPDECSAQPTPQTSPQPQ